MQPIVFKRVLRTVENCAVPTGRKAIRYYGGTVWTFFHLFLDSFGAFAKLPQQTTVIFITFVPSIFIKPASSLFITSVPSDFIILVPLSLSCPLLSSLSLLSPISLSFLSALSLSRQPPFLSVCVDQKPPSFN